MGIRFYAGNPDEWRDTTEFGSSTIAATLLPKLHDIIDELDARLEYNGFLVDPVDESLLPPWK